MLNDYKAIGRLTKDLELKKTKSNKSYISFTLAIDRGKDKQGNPMTDFINFQAWEGRADTLAKYLHKGDMVFVEGELKNNNYEDQNKVKHYSFVVNVTGFNLLPNNRKGEEQQEQSEPQEDYTNFGGEKSDLGKSIDIDPNDLPFY